MRLMNREELVREIEKAKEDLIKAKSDKRRHDVGRYLRRLERDLSEYDRRMGGI